MELVVETINLYDIVQDVDSASWIEFPQCRYTGNNTNHCLSDGWYHTPLNTTGLAVLFFVAPFRGRYYADWFERLAVDTLT
jgi:hypothetical protein